MVSSVPSTKSALQAPLMAAPLHAQAIPAGLLVSVAAPLPLGWTVTVKTGSSKPAETVFAWSIATTQLPVPLQAPPHPVNVPAVALATRVTETPSVYDPMHPLPVVPAVITQPIPSGVDSTVPEPVPCAVIVSAWTGRSKVPVTVRAWSMVTEQLPLPLHAPPQPMKAPVFACDVSVTVVPSVKLASQAPVLDAPVQVQPIPEGVEVTSPAPVPPSDTVSWRVATGSNRAVTPCGPDIVTWQLPVPLQAPDHPANPLPAAAVATSCTLLPSPKVALHDPLVPTPVLTQLTPAGTEDTVPPPVPVGVTVSN